MLHYARAAGSRFNPDQTENLSNASIRLMSGRSFLSFLFHFTPHLSSLKRGLLSQAIPCRKVLNNLDILFNKDFQEQSLSNFKLYDDERQGQRVHEMVCFNRTKWNPYMQKTCDVAGKAILAKINLRKKCVNRDKM